MGVTRGLQLGMHPCVIRAAMSGGSGLWGLSSVVTVVLLADGRGMLRRPIRGSVRLRDDVLKQ